MDEKKLRALAAELAKGLKTEAVYTTNAIESLNSVCNGLIIPDTLLEI